MLVQHAGSLFLCSTRKVIAIVQSLNIPYRPAKHLQPFYFPSLPVQGIMVAWLQVRIHYPVYTIILKKEITGPVLLRAISHPLYVFNVFVRRQYPVLILKISCANPDPLLHLVPVAAVYVLYLSCFKFLFHLPAFTTIGAFINRYCTALFIRTVLTKINVSARADTHRLVKHIIAIAELQYLA